MGERQTRSPERSPAVRTDPVRWGRRFLIGILAATILGAATLIVSVSRNPAVASQPSTPQYVLVAVMGTETQPGFAGFLVHIMPGSRALGIIPLPATMPSHLAADPTDPLWIDAYRMSGPELVRAVYADTHIRAGGYFLVSVTDADVMFELLSQVSDWPSSLRFNGANPAAIPSALYRLGWEPPSPSHHSNAGELAVLTDVMSDLPELPAGSINTLSQLLFGAFQGHPTNLSSIQLLLLGTVIRGYNLQMEPAPRVHQ